MTSICRLSFSTASFYVLLVNHDITNNITILSHFLSNEMLPTDIIINHTGEWDELYERSSLFGNVEVIVILKFSRFSDSCNNKISNSKNIVCA